MSFSLLTHSILVLRALGLLLPATNLLESRKVLGPFKVNSTGEIQGRLGIEHHGLGFVLFAEHRPIDSFLLNGNTLIAEDRNGSCYVHHKTAHLHCEDVPEDVPRLATKFGVAKNGTITFNGTTNWLLCPAQNPNTYDVYYDTGSRRKPSPYCKDAQFKFNSPNKTERHDNNGIQTREVMKHCPFVISIISNAIDGEDVKNSAFGPFILSGRSLMTSKNFNDYCFIQVTTRRLLCRSKSDALLLENWYNIDFSFSKDNNIMHKLSDQWFICFDKNGNMVGPFDLQRKEPDPSCTSKLQVIQLKAHFPSKVEQCHHTDWSPRGTKSIGQVFPADLPTSTRRESELKERVVKCPTNLVDTLFKSPSLVVPIVHKNSTKLPGNEDKIVILPTQSTAVNFFIPFTSPYFGKTCSLLFLMPYVHEMSIKPQAAPPAVEVSIFDRPVDELTTSDTLPASHILATKQLSKEIKPGQDNSLVSFPCQAGTTMSFLIASKGGLSLTVRQGGVPSESGLHVVPCDGYGALVYW